MLQDSGLRSLASYLRSPNELQCNIWSSELLVAQGIARGTRDISYGSTRRKIKSEQPEILHPRSLSINRDS